MQTVGEAGPTKIAESVRMVSPGLISRVETKHRPDPATAPTENGNWCGILGVSNPSLSLTNSISQRCC